MANRVAAAILSAVAAFAADEQPIRSQSTEVLFDLVVRDRRGRMVRDLGAEEIEILDGGKPVAIRSIRLVTSTGEGGANAADRLHELKLTTLVFEGMNREAANLAREAALTFVTKGTGPNRLAGVFEVRRNLRLLSTYTNDRAELRKAIDAATGRLRAEDVQKQVETQIRLAASNGQQADQILRGDFSSLRGPSGGAQPTDGEIQNVIERKRFEMALSILRASQTADMERLGRPAISALRAAVEQLKPLPGRKTILYFSEGLQVPPSLEPQFQALIASANAGNVSIYCIDANGLMVAARTRAAAEKLQVAMAASMEVATQSSDTAVKREQVMAFDTAEEAMKSNTYTALADLAASTGGLLIADSNDLTSPMGRIAEEISTHYEIAYAPSIDKYDGSFRPISVKVKRPKVSAQGRKGYFAMPPSAGMDVRPHEIPLLDALDRGAANLPLRAGVLRLGGSKDLVRGTIVAEVPMNALTFEEDPAARVFRLRVAVLARFKNTAGEVVLKTSRDAAQAGPIDRMEESRAGTFSWTQDFEIAPGSYTVEFAAMDRASENVAATRMDWKAEFDSVSDLSLIRRAEPAGAQQDLLTVDKARVIPSLDTEVDLTGGAPLGLFFRVDGESDAQVDIVVRRDGVEAGRMAAARPSNAAFPFVATIPSASLPSGAYEFEVTARVAGRDVRRKLAVRVKGPEAPPPAEVGTISTVEHEPAAALAIAEATALEGMGSPPESEQAAILSSVRGRAAGYLKALPDFYCLQLTHRERGSNPASLRPLDQYQEMLTFVDGKERYKRLATGSAVADEGIASHGEWGGLMSAIFSPEAAAAFRWKQWTTLGGDRAHVFEFSVDAEHSQFSLGWSGRWKGRDRASLKTAYSGLAFVDAETWTIRRLTLHAGVKPGQFPIEETTHEVDYEFQSIGGGQYLLPRRAVMQARVGRSKVVRNEMEFRDFRRWGAQSAIRTEP